MELGPNGEITLLVLPKLVVIHPHQMTCHSIQHTFLILGYWTPPLCRLSSPICRERNFIHKIAPFFTYVPVLMLAQASCVAFYLFVFL